MSQPIVFMFSGQGSQYYQMGKELFAHNAVFRQKMLDLDDFAVSRFGVSVLKEIYQTANRLSDPFDRLLFSHPAIFMAEYALAYALEQKGIRPDCVIGASLGEYAAAAVSGVLSPEDAFDCVLEQAEIITETCRNGSMLAVLGNPKLYQDDPLLHENSELAAVNYQSHFVISGEQGHIRKIMDDLREKQIPHQLLPVSYGFHSAMVDQAEHPYKRFLAQKSIRTPFIPFISSATGEAETDIQADFFWNVVRKPIRFREALQFAESREKGLYIDAGPSGTLAAFAKQILPAGSAEHIRTIMTPFHKEQTHLQQIEDIILSSPGRRL
ncbi:acyltransferase domain-containing protein [Bacillus siamensis]|uniref:acyltransferase domain-containing protein n=1 Tax=Bacillus siamensis TaxID=659243 RepID=UPI002DBFC875|nr:acyltransferase domain-containing protein [Bacillus siamensis]MEC3653506.1 acyltransferase domain-containing protein [Bacillus siamensis]